MHQGVDDGQVGLAREWWAKALIQCLKVKSANQQHNIMKLSSTNFALYQSDAGWLRKDLLDPRHIASRQAGALKKWDARISTYKQ